MPQAAIFGREFKNPALLDEALTTASCRGLHTRVADNQRLEFLGDSILQMLATEEVFAKFPDEDEGRMTARRKHMVSTAALCRAAKNTDLAARLKRADPLMPLPDDSKTIADAVEAVLGAIWLDGGWDAARAAFGFLALAEGASASEWDENWKGRLQGVTQAMTPPRQPKYELLETRGKAHEPVFRVKVSVEGLGEATGEGRSKQLAQAAAAKNLLDLTEYTKTSKNDEEKEESK